MPPIASNNSIVVEINYASDLYDTETFGKMDPYCIVRLGATKFKTDVQKNAGKNPKWNQKCILTYNMESQLSFELYDKDKLSSDDFIGCGSLNLAQVSNSQDYCWRGDIQLYRPLNKPTKQAGTLNLVVYFQGPEFQAKQNVSTAPVASPVAPVMQQPTAPPPPAAPPVVMAQAVPQQQPQVVYAQPQQPQVVYAQPQQPQVVYAQPQQPQVVYAQPPQPQVVYARPQQPGVVYAQPQQQGPNIVYL